MEVTMRLGVQKTAEMDVTVTASATAGVSSEISANAGVYNGLLRALKIRAPYWHNNVNIVEVTIKDADGDPIYSYTSTVSRGATGDAGTVTVITGLAVPIIEQETIYARVSGAPGTAVTSDGERDAVGVTAYISSELS
jgi:hypothetical protein